MMKTNKKKRTKKNFKKTKKTLKNKIRIKNIKGGDIGKESFRNMVIEFINLLKKSIETKNQNKINDTMLNFEIRLDIHKNFINTLIPISNKKEKNIDKVPLLVIFFNNINDNNIRKEFIKYFIRNMGNINLTSLKNISALSTAINLQDIELVIYLLDNGASTQLLTPKDYNEYNKLMEEEDKTFYLTNEPPTIKLIIPTELPPETGYNPDVEPEFWKQIFKNNEMISIRNKIHEMMNIDASIPIENDNITELWSVCKINETIIPTYFTKTKNELYSSPSGMFFKDLNTDFARFNIILCAALIIFGIISNKMIGQDYKLVFKGGKATQLVLGGMKETTKYITEDIDLLIMPNKDIEYNEINVKNLAGHLAYLIKWFLNSIEQHFIISVQPPNPQNIRANPFIYKLSYNKFNQPNRFKQFSDIDFKEVPEIIKEYFNDIILFNFYVEELKETLSFYCPNIGSLLNEKLYYYCKFFRFKKMLEKREIIREPEYTSLTIFDCERFLEKFKRAILAMNTGLQKQRFNGISGDELINAEKNFVLKRLSKFQIDAPLKNEIVKSLYN